MKHKERKRLKEQRLRARKGNDFEKIFRHFIKKRKESKMSYGENLIAEFLKDNNINFIREHYFKDFVVNGVRKILFYDFYLPEYNICIEFDGQQHYTGVYKGKKCDGQGKRDFLKTSYCRSKGIKLLRIKYDQVKNIETIICKFIDRHYPV
jgi:very-short-patch-repair endonuclease